ncbi:uncharacterized protein LOC126998114 isoform X3 [Eriocheir sinensis]|nr:uncharacterized protein LOC126998114 isoform X3 [Eriocheir sinensis]XP_050715479.1 uncharacterized protein LOC126998114 isoform X3 [Eriocheir sinensis]XP_050715480.1 uncharacterized protein LOC126998114 isoform X3 [Eriocheir sinensis]
MLEEDDEPKRASGETKPELRVAESQTDSPEEEIEEAKGGEDKEKQDQEECEAETSQIQEEKEEEEEEEKKEKTLEKEEHEDKSQIIEDKTNIDEQETNEVKIKTDEQQKDAEVEEKRELPQVKSDKEDNSKEKQEGDKVEDIIKAISEQSTESSLNKEAEEQTEVCNKKEESPEVTQQETSASQDNLDKDLPQENVGVAKQVVEEEEQELVSNASSDQQTNAAGLDQTPEARSEKVEEEDMLVEPLKEEAEEMAESEESNPTSQKMTSDKSGKEETVPEIINKNTTDGKEKINTDQEMEDSSIKEGEAAQEDDKEEGVDVEMNDTEQNKNGNPTHTETAAEKGTPPPSGNADSDVDVEDLGDAGKTYTPEKGGEDLNAEDQDENYDELNDSDDGLELKICIEGITEVGENADETSEEAAESEAKTGEEGEDQETEEMPLCEEAMEVDEAMEEGGNDDDVECDEVNGLGAIEDDEDLNDEEFISEDTTNSSFQDGGSLPQCRLKRNYTCVHCGINTQNPREYLYHLRDDHGEKMKVFECSHCIYASKNHQKLIRHARMVHKVKIKKQEASPCKPPSKPSGIAPTTNKLTRASVSPGKSSRSSPGKSPRSNDSAQDEWDVMDEEDDQEFDQDGSPIKGDEKKLYFCEQCSYSCRSRKLLNRHETSYHLKRRFFRCVKCNYVTHLKGRYTKHLKYHQLPILKCDFCDFRTPYRWNLDRHLKNHTEECGEFKCHLCNFTAQIKQSLTVHISNHHLTSEQIRERERRRTIGISDPADCAFDDQEMELLRLERDEHPDALIPPGYDGPDSPTASEPPHGQHNGNNSFRVSNIDVGGQDDSQVNADDGKDEDGEPKRKKPKIKITLKKMKVSKPKDTFFQELNERHNFEEDFIHPDDVVHRHGNVYIKNFKCRFCTFKAAFKNEIMRHEKKVHSTPGLKAIGQAKKARKTIKSSKVLRSSSSDDVLTQILQFPQNENKNESAEIIPAECLQKLSETEDAMSNVRDDEGSSKDKDEAESENLNEDQEDSMEAVDEQSPDSKETSPSKDSAKKKSLSFFEKLQEKMPTSNVQNLVCQFCGHESKCLSESVRHQKLHLSAKNIYAPASLSTRCQFCRHRCKTTDDLMSHLKLCPEARKNQITDSGRRASGSRLDENEDSQCSSERGENADYDDNDDNEEDSMNEVADKTPVLVDGTIVKREDMKHPMENRVFVWNNIDKSDDQEKSSVEKREKVDSGSRRSSTESNKRKRSGSKSPVDMEGSLDYYIESPTPKGHHYYTKRVYRCPQCSFWATTASRFHVHIVGHFNRKPYNCSECGYKSNWRWDITKHIKLKTSRDSSHQNARVLITDETGEKNYEKYDCYLAIIQLDETNAHRTEGGIPTRKGRPKRTPEKDEVPEPVTPSASPIRKPPMVTIPVMPRLQAMPRLTRAPGRSTPTSRPGPMPFGPILPGAQLMVQIAGSRASGSSSPRPPPPLTPKGALKSGSSSPSSSTTTTATTKTTSSGNTAVTNPVAGGQYQIITPQGSVNTSLETLQLLASGSTNLSKLKKQQKSSLLDSEEKDSKATLSHQMRFLAWLNLLMTDAEEQVSVSSTGEDGKEVAKMVLDHEGNPEWKCNTCDFRDSERETVVQHVRLAHTRNGPVSLLHAVHRCDVCGYAAGTKRAVQLHIDSSHGGQGGITSRCEGQNPDTKESGGDAENAEYSENARTYHCRQCPFTCKKRSEMKPHLTYHTERADCIFKCMFCPYYVPTRSELFEHLRVHGMEVPSSVVDATNKNSSSPISSQDDIGGPRQFICSACPFETRSRAKLMHHKQFHKPKGLPFRCPHCTYNVTRRHLLSQHIRVHGIEDTLEGNGNGDMSQMDDRSNSPSPSLTITPVTNAATGSSGEDSALTDSSNLPKLTDESTTRMEDIPLVWVSRDHRFFKMFKCRHCPHVNLRKTNIQEHEKMHKTDISKEAGGLHCPYCSYVSVNAGVMSAHLKVHGGSMGQCHAVVDPSLSDEDQLKQLTSRGPAASTETTQAAADKLSNWKNDEKILYYCQRCPARFFLEKEIQIHSRFHNTSLPHTCDHCNYGTRHPAHLLTHLKVHTPEYQQRTRSMMGQHRTASSYPPVPGLTIPHELADLSGEKHSAKEAGGSGSRPFSSSPPPAPGVMPQPPPTSKYMCDQCPATFSKLVTLQYHQSLHGTKNPHPCPKCTYAGKTWDSLQQHILLHNQYDQNCQAEKAANESAKKAEAQKALEASLSSKISQRTEKDNNTSSIPPLKLKLIGPRPGTGENNHDGSRPQFKYYVEEQVPLSGVDLLRRKTQMEKEGDRHFSDVEYMIRPHVFSKSKGREDMEEEDPKRIGDPQLHYPLHIDKVTGKSREKRYKCSKCPSAFEKVEQYTVHTNLHGSSHKYRCRICDYSVKFYANFMMHIKRHKYHERMEAQTSGETPPLDNDSKYEPIVSKENSSQGEKVVSSKTQNEEHSNKENLEEADLTTIERQHLLLQNKKGVGEAPKKDDERERRVYYCQYCPYANIRRDAVDSHSMRHRANGGFGSYKCTFCDYTASQPNFIREHTKVHFRPFKYVHPEGFMRHDRQEIFSLPVGSGTKAGNKQKSDGSSQSAPEKYVIYSHEVGNANPAEESEGEEEENVNAEMVKSIQVNFHSGDIVEAPFDYVVSLRPKFKATSFHLEANDVTNNSSEVAEKVERMNPEAAVPSTSGENGSVGTEQAPQKDESMEVDENTTSGENEKTEMPTEPSGEPKSLVEDHDMETESPEDTENLQNGHVEEIHEVTKPPVKSQENVKVSESKLSELSQPLGKSKGSTPSES